MKAQRLLRGHRRTPSKESSPSSQVSLGWSLLMGWGYPGAGHSLGQEKVGNPTRILAGVGLTTCMLTTPRGSEVSDFEGHCLHGGLSYLCWPWTV